MSEKIDHVAEAIVEYIIGGPHDSKADMLEDLQNGMDVEDMVRLMPRELARVAIAAMHNPTQPMLRAGDKAATYAEEFVGDIYRVMIDAAISPPTDG